MTVEVIAACIGGALVAISAVAAFAYSVCARLNKLEDQSSSHLTRWAYWSDRVRRLERDAGLVLDNVHLVPLDDEPTFPGRPKSVRPPAAR